MPSFLQRSFRGGISKFEERGLPGASKFIKNANIRKKIDSFSCNQALVDEVIVGSTLTALPLFIIPTTTGKDYAFCRDGKIFERDRTTKQWTYKYTDTNEQTTGIIGAAEWTAGGVKFLFWCTATRLNCKPLPGASDWSDVNTGGSGGLASMPKTNLTSFAFHYMKEAVGNLMITNGNALAMVGFDGSYTNNALEMIPGNVSNTLIERGVNVEIGCGRSDGLEQASLFEWNPANLVDTWNYKNLLPFSGINAMIDTDVSLMQVGTEGALMYADMQNKLPIQMFPGGGSCNPAGVCNDAGLALFGIFGNGAGYTGIYSYGRKQMDENRVLNLEYQIDCDEIGAVEKIAGEILCSVKIGLNFHIKRVDSTKKAVAVLESLDNTLASDVYPYPKTHPRLRPQLPQWTRVLLTHAPLPTGTSIAIARKVDKFGSFIPANLESSVPSQETVGAIDSTFFIGDGGRTFEYQCTLTPYLNDSPEVYKIETFFE